MKRDEHGVPRDEHGLVPRDFFHGYLLVQAGKLRNMDMETIEGALMRLVHENCAPPIDESKVKAVKAMAKLICSCSFPTPEHISALNLLPKRPR